MTKRASETKSAFPLASDGERLADVKAPEDVPTIDLSLCKSKDKVVAEYALRYSTKPMGVAEYQLVQALPAQFETSLPSIEQIESELGESETAHPARPSRLQHSARPKGGGR